MDKRQEIGKKGEKITEKFLKQNGYTIKERNFRTRHGEIDIIAAKESQLIFIEVKTRTNNNYGFASEAIDKRKQIKIYNTAKYYLYTNNISETQIRIDAIEVYFLKNKIKINHIKQVM